MYQLCIQIKREYFVIHDSVTDQSIRTDVGTLPKLLSSYITNPGSGDQSCLSSTPALHFLGPTISIYQEVFNQERIKILFWSLRKILLIVDSFR